VHLVGFIIKKELRKLIDDRMIKHTYSLRMPVCPAAALCSLDLVFKTFVGNLLSLLSEKPSGVPTSSGPLVL